MFFKDSPGTFGPAVLSRGISVDIVNENPIIPDKFPKLSEKILALIYHDYVWPSVMFRPGLHECFANGGAAFIGHGFYNVESSAPAYDI